MIVKGHKDRLVLMAALAVATLVFLLVVSNAFVLPPRWIFLSNFNLELPYFAARVDARRKAGHLDGLASDDPRVVRHVKDYVLVAPSTAPYNLLHGVKNNDPSAGQSHIVDEVLGGMRNGFYVESGGYTGETLSNTLFFELERGWQGLLIEPDDRNFRKLVSRNRKCYSANACLSETNSPKSVSFLSYREPYSSRIMLNGTSDDVEKVLFDYHNIAQMSNCFPLQSFLLAIGNSTVDYFSLDVEGSEYKVLASIPWDKLNIKTLSVEYNLIDEGKEALIKLMTSKGYIYYMEFNTVTTHDLIFVKEGILKNNENSNHYPIIINQHPSKPMNLSTWDKLFD